MEGNLSAVEVILCLLCLLVWAFIANIAGAKLASWTKDSPKRHGFVVGTALLLPLTLATACYLVAKV